MLASIWLQFNFLCVGSYVVKQIPVYYPEVSSVRCPCEKQLVCELEPVAILMYLMRVKFRWRNSDSVGEGWGWGV